MKALYTGSLRIKISYFHIEKSNIFNVVRNYMAHCINSRDSDPTAPLGLHCLPWGSHPKTQHHNGMRRLNLLFAF